MNPVSCAQSARAVSDVSERAARYSHGPRKGASALALTLLLLASSAAAGQPSVEARARVLFDAGVAAVDKGDFATGCPKLAESVKLVERAGTRLNLARCDEREGRLVKAQSEWERGIALLPPHDERLPLAKDRLAKLQRRLSKLVIKLDDDAPSDVRIAIDGAVFDQAGLGEAVALDPGHHAVALSAPGRSEQRIDVTLREGETNRVTLSFVKRSGSELPGEAPPPTDAPGSGQRIAGFLVGGVGVAGVVVAGVTSAMLASRDAAIRRACPDKICTPAGGDLITGSKTLFVVNAIAWPVGIAGLGLSAILLITAAGAEPRTTAPAAVMVVVPTAFPGGAGVLVAGSF